MVEFELIYEIQTCLQWVGEVTPIFQFLSKKPQTIQYRTKFTNSNKKLCHKH